ncbi:cobyrinic acid a,c-diamide synthase [Hylemonella gracilis str. Niagara R]|uniref:Cobyrinic acid a,c-diamide synthase n=1 Tax=Hylemonella gracilis str. Niagara R TaxID=1458275 RepID=A0A016XI59_9BURK|nr:cobyrinate a,c-diamide synthase [Hylemonella gracilis]EYC51550.1 cobyrinic acid a,c-diamide synthase [Hylemonella gracilis str. Niagara R]
MTAPSRCPALLIAAPASGQGKTTVTAALARLHARQGRRVRVFKCGPDFLDPFWHTLASGAPVHQLDLWMTGEADCRARLHQAAREADLILVEGVMGLYDGQPSAADLARHFGLPVLAVIDASAMAGTFGALAHGLQHYQDGLPWAGVLANRAGSARHAGMLQRGLREPEHWLGALSRNPALVLPERHLGLVAATELHDALQRLDAAADALADTPLGRMTLDELRLRWRVDFAPPATNPPMPALLQGRTVAVARDAAFCFLYAANLECLQALGARLVFFSPLTDSVLPVCDAVWLPGGYPELHAARLAANHGLRDSLRAHVAAGRPLWAECGGMMALFERLTDGEGLTHALWGLLPGSVTLQKRLAALGPQALQIDDAELRGHTFHYSTCDTPLRPRWRTRPPGGGPVAGEGEAVYQQGSIVASYFHAWFPSAPPLVARLFGAGQQQSEALAA